MKKHQYTPGNIMCQECEIRDCTPFKAMTDMELEEVNKVKKMINVEKGEELFHDGGVPRGVYCLNKGKVKIYKVGEEGKEQIIHIAKEGEIVGFRAMFSEDKYNVSATALEDCNICFIDSDSFFNLVDNNKTLRRTILKELSSELAYRADLLTSMAQKHVRERVAYSLLFLDDIYNGDMINFSREDLANFVGTATETLIRLLKELKEENVIQTHGRKIEILNKEELLRRVRMY